MLVPVLFVSVKELATAAHFNVLTDPITTGSWWSKELFLPSSLYMLFLASSLCMDTVEFIRRIIVLSTLRFFIVLCVICQQPANFSLSCRIYM